MMSSATTQRAGRAPKDKNKPQAVHTTTENKDPTEGSKTSDDIVSKIKPTAQQLIIAQILNNANKADYPDLKDKVEKIIKITGQSTEAALMALHDCDNDTDRAAIMLLEGNQDEGKWEIPGKKKKNRQFQQKIPEVNCHDQAPVEKEKQPVENTNRRRDTPRAGGYRYRGPPRMNRGGNQDRNLSIFRESNAKLSSDQKMTSEFNKQKIRKIYDIFPGATKGKIAKILQYYDDDENKAMDALLRDGGSEALSNWVEPGGLERKNNKKEKLRQYTGFDSSAAASFDAYHSSSVHTTGNVDAEVEKECSVAENRNGRRIGIICENERNSEELSVQWDIRNFFALSGSGGDYYDSPDFNFSDALWCLTMYSNGEKQNPPSGCVDLYLLRKDPGPPATIQFTLCITGAEGVEIGKREGEQNFSENVEIGWSKFLPRHLLRNHQSLLMPNGVLTITCRMKSAARGILSYHVTPSQTDGQVKTIKYQDQVKPIKFQQQVKPIKFRQSSTRAGESPSLNKEDASIQTDEELTETKALSEENISSEKQGLEKVGKDIGKLLISGENSDITVQVGDREFSVHRNILSVRSPVLSAMFRHDTAESMSNKVTIEDCEPDVFRDFLQYLYTGSVRSLTEQNVFGLYRVADKYLADDLKSRCLKHIRDALCVQTFCDTVKLALTHEESDLLKLAIDFAAENIQSIIISVEWQNFICEYPREANEILIKSIIPRS